ncbi:MAG: hypothetical protein SNF33_00260 (plasmid) [Candidatus Algichlamydia australiensis]|nr:hypothetical protein [Chlamydiales bacterium]
MESVSSTNSYSNFYFGPNKVLVKQEPEGKIVNYRNFIPSLYLSAKYDSRNDTEIFWGYDLFGGSNKLIGVAFVLKDLKTFENERYTVIHLNPGSIGRAKTTEIARCVVAQVSLRVYEPFLYWSNKPTAMICLAAAHLWNAVWNGSTGSDEEAVERIDEDAESVRATNENAGHSVENLEATNEKLSQLIGSLKERLDVLTTKLGIHSDALENNGDQTLAEQLEMCRSAAERILSSTSDTLEQQSRLQQETRDARDQIRVAQEIAKESHELGNIANNFAAYLNDLDETCPGIGEKEYDHLLGEWEKLDESIFSITDKVKLIAKRGKS